MSEHENELQKALAENGTFDSEKAKAATAAAVSQFHARLKKVERIMWVYLAVCVGVIVFAWNAFEFASSTKAIVGFGILLLVAYETTILMKLCYWIANTKLTLLKEIKQWQLQTAATPSAVAAEPWGMETRIRQPGLSRWERIVWIAALAIVACAVSTFIHNHTVATITLGQCVALKTDGAGTSTMSVSYRIQGRGPTISFPFTMGRPEEKGAIRWLDERGRELPFDVSTENGQRHYTVRLIEPVMPGEWLRYTQITESPSSATKEGDLWTYQSDFTYGGQNNQYLVTVELPRGAKLVSADPKPVEQSTINGIPRVVLQADRGSNDRFRYKIQYQLANEAGFDEPRQ